MLTFALLKNSVLSFESLTINEIRSHKFKQFLLPFVDIIQIESDDMTILMKEIVDKLKLSPTDTCDCYKCFETHNELYHLIYSTTSVVGNENILGRFLSRDHTNIFGECALIKTTINNDCTTTPSNITIDDVATLFAIKLVHKSLLIGNDKMEEYYFIKSPLDQIDRFNDNDCKYVKIEFLGKILMLFIKSTPTEGYINRKATILYKKYKIIGDVVIALMTVDPVLEYHDVDADLFKKIMAVMSDCSFSRNITDIEDVDGVCDTNTNIIKTTNFYKILNDRFIKYGKNTTDDFIDIIPDDVLNGPTLNSTLII